MLGFCSSLDKDKNDNKKKSLLVCEYLHDKVKEGIAYLGQVKACGFGTI